MGRLLVMFLLTPQHTAHTQRSTLNQALLFLLLRSWVSMDIEVHVHLFIIYHTERMTTPANNSDKSNCKVLYGQLVYHNTRSMSIVEHLNNQIAKTYIQWTFESIINLGCYATRLLWYQVAEVLVMYFCQAHVSVDPPKKRHCEALELAELC